MNPAASSARRKLNSAQVAIAVRAGIIGGAVLGALILGIQQWRNESWQDEYVEILQWVLPAALFGVSAGAIAGAILGLFIGLVWMKTRR